MNNFEFDGENLFYQPFKGGKTTDGLSNQTRLAVNRAMLRESAKLLTHFRKQVANWSRRMTTENTGIDVQRQRRLEQGISEISLIEFIAFMAAIEQRPDSILQPLFQFYDYLVNSNLTISQINDAKLGDEYKHIAAIHDTTEEIEKSKIIKTVVSELEELKYDQSSI
jgi:hypothetical protein